MLLGEAAAVRVGPIFTDRVIEAISLQPFTSLAETV
jgi:hypothetical protein